jgi:hypothetical protein
MNMMEKTFQRHTKMKAFENRAAIGWRDESRVPIG